MNAKITKLALAMGAMALAGGAMAASFDTTTLTATMTLTSRCESTATATLAFGSKVALFSTGDVDGNTGSTLQVACSASTAVLPTMYAAATREMTGGASDDIAFLLSAASSGGTELGTDKAGGTLLTIAKDGTLKDVVLHGRVPVANFQGMPTQAYSGTVLVSFEY